MTLRFPVSLASSLTILALVGCTAQSDVTSPHPSAVPTVAPSSSPAPGAPADPARRITGSVTLNAAMPDRAMLLGLKKFDGATWQQVEAATSSTDASGSFSFDGLTAGTYQVVSDNQATDLVNAAVDPTGIYVSEGLVVPETGEATVSFDVGWVFSPNVGPNSVFVQGDSFSFSANDHVAVADYQVVVCDANKKLIWSSAWGSHTSFMWNGYSGTDTNLPSDVMTPNFSPCYYAIKFRKTGSTFGGNGPYGQTKWIPFAFMRLSLEV